METRTVEDYIDQVKERYPELSEKQIKRILEFGVNQYLLLNTCKADVRLAIQKPVFLMHTGRLFLPSSGAFFRKFWVAKMRIKIRLKYARKKPKWNGKYYFGLTTDQYKERFSKKHRREKIDFGTVWMFKILDEAMICGTNYFFEVDWPKEGHMAFQQHLITNKYKLLYHKDMKAGTIRSVAEKTPKLKYKQWQHYIK